MSHSRLLNLSTAILLILPIFIAGCGDEGDPLTKTTLPPTEQPPDNSQPPSTLEPPIVVNPPVEEPPVVVDPPVEEPPIVVNPPVEQPPIEAPGISFQDEVFPIFEANCTFAGCHAAPAPSGLLLTTFGDFEKGGNGGAAFVAGDSGKSLVVLRVDGGGMPLGRAPLKAAEIQLIKDWIDEGAEDN